MSKYWEQPKTTTPDPQPYCECGEDLGLVRIVTESGEHLCLECFDIKYPRWSLSNRFKKPGEQLKLSI